MNVMVADDLIKILAAGAAAGLSKATAGAVNGAVARSWNTLLRLLKTKMRDDDAASAIDAGIADPQELRRRVGTAFSDAEVENDPEIDAAATEVRTFFVNNGAISTTNHGVNIHIT